jgi:hypothetical protein
MSSDRCVWCNKPGPLTTVTLVVPDNLLAVEDSRSFTVHGEDEPLLREFVGYLRRSKRPLMVSLGIGMLGLPLSAIAGVALDLPVQVIRTTYSGRGPRWLGCPALAAELGVRPMVPSVGPPWRTGAVML